MRSPITWYGGKGLLARQIVPLLPTHDTYVEAFAGGASVFFAKPPAAIEVLNDIHAGIVSLYRVLRDPEMAEAFTRLCHLTPFSREEWRACSQSWETESDPVQRAWRFFVTARQTFSGHLHHGAWKCSIADPGTRAVGGWLSAIEGLPAVHERLREVHVEHADWREILTRYDRPNILHYLDPPYILATRQGGARYEHEMSEADHRELAERVLAMDSMVMLSGFQHEIYAPLEMVGWQRLDFDMPVAAAKERSASRRTESVWVNPAAAAGRSRQLTLEELPA